MKSPLSIFLIGISALISLTGFIYLEIFSFSVHANESTGYLMTQQHDSPDNRLKQAYTRFGLNLFTAMTKDKIAENILISPPSVAIALSLLYNGASGQTQQEMSQVLALQGMTLTQINQANQRFQKSLDRSDQGVNIHSANSLWVRQGVALRHSFLRNNRNYYQAEVTNLNFNNPQAVGIINRWVSQQTQRKITEIIDKISPNDILFLINAIYFKGVWQSPFNADLTESDTFYLSNGKTEKHLFMIKQGDFLYQETTYFQAVSLPYGDTDWRFDLFLPKENSNLKNIIIQLNETNWNQWLKRFKKKEGFLKVPRFQSEFVTDLTPTLKALGMKTAFIANKANFSQMTSDQVVVDSIRHKTFIEVNEEGTEAAAVTSIGVRVTSALPSADPFKMIANRPFFYTIRQAKTGTILFIGIMANP